MSGATKNVPTVEPVADAELQDAAGGVADTGGSIAVSGTENDVGQSSCTI